LRMPDGKLSPVFIARWFQCNFHPCYFCWQEQKQLQIFSKKMGVLNKFELQRKSILCNA
jgi:hypothetical protein